MEEMNTKDLPSGRELMMMIPVKSELPVKSDLSAKSE